MTSSKNRQNGTFERILSIVKQIPAGKVATYGQIASLTASGLPARIVGFALHGLPVKTNIPWHRVINSRGSISFSPARQKHDSLQQSLLENEGVLFNQQGKVNLKKYLWEP